MSEAVRYYTRNRKENSSEDSGVESGNSLENNGEQSNELSNWNWDEEIIQIYTLDTTTQYSVCEIITILGCQWVLGYRCGINQALLWDIRAGLVCLSWYQTAGRLIWSINLIEANYHNQIVEDPIECQVMKQVV